MMKTVSLRRRILALIAASGVAVVAVAACNSSSSSEEDSPCVPELCCDSRVWECFGHNDLWDYYAGDLNADNDFTGCPATTDLSHGSDCANFRSGPRVEGDKCCYLVDRGTCCGRPFLVGGEAIRASVEARDDWASAIPTIDAREGWPSPISTVDALDEATRAALGSAWLDDARLEHASIASFARFTLHLLALGAPADLVEAAQRASLDEVAHARACFALASRYAGAALGPGPLPVEGSLGAVTLAGAAATAAREGCVGETIAAAVAAEQLDRATDPDARAALATIARDEAAHAELAWRFVAWALARGGGEVRSAVADAFAEARAASACLETSVDPAGIDSLAWRRHGRLTRPEIRAGEWRTWREVIGPCADALLTAARGSMTAAPEWHTKSAPMG